MSEQKSSVLRTYAKSWEFDYIIYGYGDFKLPFSISLSQLGFFAIGFILVTVICKILPFIHVGIILRLAMSYGLMKVGMHLDVDGKKSYIWLYRQIMYILFQPKRLCRFSKAEEPKSFSFNPMPEVVVK